jgi:KaiC/GvpD/RAD55 family RecA-like ATPase
MDIFELVNNLSAESVLSRLLIPKAKDGKSYVCPLCDNGTGSTGDGIKPRKSNGRVRWKCHKCGVDFSNFDLIACTLGSNPEFDKSEAVRQVKELFGYYDDGNGSFSSSKKKSARASSDNQKRSATEMDEKKSASESTPKNYTRLYAFCRGNVEKFLSGHGGSFRGLTASTFAKYGIGVHPDFSVEEREKCPHLIIPYSDSHFFARAVVGHDRSQHGAFTGLYEPVPINPKQVNFLFEGEIDALSAAQEIGNLEIGCVAIGGIAKADKVVPFLDERFGDAEDKPMFIVTFDNDDGIAKAHELVHKLRAAGYPAETFFFEGRKAGESYELMKPDGTIEKCTVKKVDANDILQRGEGKLREILIDAIDDLGCNLDEQATAMKQSDEQERRDSVGTVEAVESVGKVEVVGIKDFSFSRYFSSDFFRDIERKTKYADRTTGFDNLDAAQIFMPGLYMVGALPATGKTTWAWQLLSNLAANGELCLYCSYEMSRTELFAKSMAREMFLRNPELSKRLNLSSANIRRGACRDIPELHEQAASFASSGINLRVLEVSDVDVKKLVEYLKPIAAAADKPPVICIDYLQIIPPTKSKLSPKEKLDEIALSLKDFQRETDSTIIAISSFNRENYYQPVSFSSFKESGALEYGCDVLWGLENCPVHASEISKEMIIEESKKKNRSIKLSCLKNRNGGQYECYFRYHAAHDYFEPVDANELKNESQLVYES